MTLEDKKPTNQIPVVDINNEMINDSTNVTNTLNIILQDFTYT